MKFRWHLLCVVIASAVAGLFWFWSLQSLWRVEGFDQALHAGYCIATHEVRSLILRKVDDSWYLETRDGRDGRLLKDVKLDRLTKEDGVLIVANGTTDKPSNAPLVIISSKTNQFAGELALVFDPDTGERRERIQISTSLSELPSISGDKVAIFTQQKLWLIDGVREARKLSIPGIQAVRIAPDGNYVVCRNSDGLHFVQWDSDRLIKAYPNDEVSEFTGIKSFDFRFLNNGLLLIRQYLPDCSLTRWQWNGSEIEQVAPVLIIGEKDWDVKSLRVGQLLIIEDQHQTHFVSYGGPSWPREFRALFIWLSKMGLPVVKWLPPETTLLWHVVDENHRELYRYEEQIKLIRPLRLTNTMQISYGSRLDYRKSIEMWNTAARWPNALACGIVVYLILYLVARCRKRQNVFPTHTAHSSSRCQPPAS